jgi:hypothetical protein
MSIFTTNPIISLRTIPINTQQLTCRKYKGFLPNITPAIYSLSSTISVPGEYALVYINGQNFTPNNLSVTFGTITDVPIVFYSSFSISFVVPLYVSEGNYEIQVVANNNNTLMSGLLYSNTVNYTIQNYSITGSYSISDNKIYNTIITFSGNGTILFNKTLNINWNITGDASVSVNGQLLTNSSSYLCSINTNYSVILGSGSVTLFFNV